MIHVAKLHEQFKLSVNRIDSNYNKSFSTSVIDSYLNKAQDAVITRFMRHVERNTTVRNHLRVLENKEVSLPVVKKTPGYVVVSYPDNFYRLLRQTAKVRTAGCSELRDVIVHTIQSDKISESLRDPNWRPDADWGETIGDESHDGYYVYKQSDWEIEEVIVDYMRKPQEMFAPSLAKGSYITSDGRMVTSDQHCEFSDTYLWRYIADLASFYAMRDQGQVDDAKTKMEEMVFSEIVKI